ncbi:sugar kinase [Ktedonobacteria bacterium brp13]|nr:sugar kinase [Ktedonobacteria bacterium brp13]
MSRDQQGTPHLLREINERRLLEYLWYDGSASRAQLARTTGLSKPTVSQALAHLEQARLVRPVGQVGSGGRTATLYEPDPTAGYVIGVDIGRSWIRIAIANLNGTIIERRNMRNHERNASGLVDLTAQLINSAMVAARLTRAQITHTVIGCPGIFDPHSGHLILAPNLPGGEQDTFIDKLQAEFGPHLMIENDINLAVLGEHTYGCGKEIETLAFLSVGTGIGMGIIINGRLYRGAHGAGGEIGFLPFNLEEPLRGPAIPTTPLLHAVTANSELPEVSNVKPGQRGKLEEAAAADGIVRIALAHGMRAPLSAKRIFDAARDGDPLARTVIEREGQLLAHAIASITAILDPQLIVLGGGIGLNIDLLLGPIERSLHTITPLRAPRIMASELEVDATLLGAITTALEAARQHIFQNYIGSCNEIETD